MNDDKYLELLKQCLNASLYDESAWTLISEHFSGGIRQPVQLARSIVRRLILKVSRLAGFSAVRTRPYDAAKREEGRDFPMFGYTMVGLRRLDNVHECIRDVVGQSVPGDLVEAGVWRGGCAILMRAVLSQMGAADRVVWAADSFEGLPRPNRLISGLPDEADLSGTAFLKVSLEQVQANFKRFGLLDDRVRFLKGWFKDTLANAPIERIAVLRLDGDLYESTMDTLVPLYSKMSPGGYVIVDDYYCWPGCRKAVDEFRQRNGIEAEMKRVDRTCAYWQVPR